MVGTGSRTLEMVVVGGGQANKVGGSRRVFFLPVIILPPPLGEEAERSIRFGVDGSLVLFCSWMMNGRSTAELAVRYLDL